MCHGCGWPGYPDTFTHCTVSEMTCIDVREPPSSLESKGVEAHAV